MESNIPAEYPSKPWQPLFDCLSGLCEIPPTLSEMEDLINVVDKMIGHTALQSKCDRYESVIASLNNTGFIKGVPGATWGDTDYDSLAAAAGYNQAVMNMKSLILKALNGEGEKVVISDDEKNKAWDEWRDSLINRDNVLVHHKERPEKYTEPFTFEEFKAVMLEKSPVFIYNTMYSNDKPLYQMTSQFMPSGVDFFCTSWADKTPQRITLEKFYHRLKTDGLEYVQF